MSRAGHAAWQRQLIQRQRRQMAREKEGDALLCCLSCQTQLTDADRDEATPDGLCVECRKGRAE